MSNYIFDESEYPLRVSCYALPSFDGETAEIDIPIDDEEQLRVSGIPEAHLQRLNMPRLSPKLPEFVKEPFERGIGLGLVACRMLRQENDQVELELPTTPEPTVVTVPLRRLARQI
jgi:hypothetical protein